MTVDLLKVQAELTNLVCFQEINSISKSTTGQSHPAYIVESSNERYFAKYFEHQNQRVYESQLADYFHLNKIAPHVTHAEGHWLILPFIDTVSLNIAEKQKSLLQQLAKLHQLDKPGDIFIDPIDFSAVLSHLIANASSTKEQQLCFNDTAKLLLESLKPNPQNQRIVICHGDANYENMLLATSGQCYLIDFESVCLAAPEYDLGMFLAINLIDLNKIDEMIDYYIGANKKAVQISNRCVTRYYEISLFINGLWYLNKYFKSKTTTWLSKAKNQFLPLIQRGILSGDLNF